MLKFLIFGTGNLKHLKTKNIEKFKLLLSNHNLGKCFLLLILKSILNSLKNLRSTIIHKIYTSSPRIKTDFVNNILKH